jgi:hypothetical protein
VGRLAPVCPTLWYICDIYSGIDLALGSGVGLLSAATCFMGRSNSGKWNEGFLDQDVSPRKTRYVLSNTGFLLVLAVQNRRSC